MLHKCIRSVLFRLGVNFSRFRAIRRNYKFTSGKSITYAIFPFAPIFDYKYDNFGDFIGDANDINLNKLYREFQKSSRNDLQDLLFYEKTVDTLVNVNVRILTAESKIIYLHLLLISTNYCSNNKDSKLDQLISKLILIYSTHGKYIIDTFPRNQASKNLIAKLKQYQVWNFNNESILDTLIKFLLSIKCKINGGKLDTYEKALLLEMKRKRLYNIYISSFYSNTCKSCKGYEVNFVGKWVESLYYLIVINLIHVYNFIKLIQNYDYTAEDISEIEFDRQPNHTTKNKIEMRSARNNKIKSLTDIDHNQTDLTMEYYRHKQQKSHSEWSYSGNSTIFQMERGRYSPTRSDYVRRLPKCTMEEPLWPE